MTGDEMEDAGTINRVRQIGGFEPVESNVGKMRFERGMWVPT